MKNHYDDEIKWGRNNMIKRIQLNLIIGIVILGLLSFSITPIVSSDDASQWYTVDGYVFIDDILTTPDDIIFTIEEQNPTVNIPGEPYTGYYDISNAFEATDGAEGTFIIIINGISYPANPTLVIDNTVPYYENFNLSVNTSNPPENHLPDAPTTPFPADGATGVSTSPTLSIIVSDADGDSMNVTFYDASDDSIIGTDLGVNDGNTATLTWSGLSYSTLYSWYAVANDGFGDGDVSPTWTFTTESAPSPPDDDDDDVTPGDDDDDSTPSGGGGGGTVIQNQPPTAAATVDVTTGNPGLICTFDASDSSDSDGEILEYQWDFDDGTTETTNNATISHTFTYTGTFNVMLTVTDDDGATDEIDEPIIIEIIPGNNPPTDLVVTAETTKTKKNTEVQFSITATDPDDNDSIHYNVSWGDAETITSAEYNSSELFEISHRWDNYGVYTVTVTAYDSQNATSETSTTTMYVDVHPITGEITGLLIDEDSDGTYDTFKDDTTETTLEKHNESNYLIDSNNDGEWDYMYDVDSETLTTYSTDEPDEADDSNMAVYLLLGLIIVLFIVFGYLAYKKQQHEKKNAEKRKKAETKKQNKKKSSSKKKK